MERAIWNNTEILACKIAEKYEVEHEVRKASSAKLLRCPDKNCQQPVVRYCHGKKKEAYFAHLSNVECDYDKFATNSSKYKPIRIALYNYFSKSVCIELEQKVLPHHYSQLLFTFDNNSKLAIEFGDVNTLAKQIDTLEKEYKDANIFVQWIGVGETKCSLNERRTFWLQRHALNTSPDNQFLIINPKNLSIGQYRKDITEYSPEFRNYPDLYFKEEAIDSLKLTQNGITLAAFEESYNNWLDDKHDKYKKYITALQYKTNIERPNITTTKKQYTPSQTTLQDFEEDIKPPTAIICNDFDEILKNIDQQELQVRDRDDNRWIKCKCCGKVLTTGYFSEYGGAIHADLNLGICSECSRNKTNKR